MSRGSFVTGQDSISASRGPIFSSRGAGLRSQTSISSTSRLITIVRHRIAIIAIVSAILGALFAFVAALFAILLVLFAIIGALLAILLVLFSIVAALFSISLKVTGNFVSVIDEVVGTCEALVAPQASAKGLAISIADCDRTLMVRVDAEKMQQIVLNLLSNAMKFTEPGGRITLAWTAGIDAVAITVRDTGHGIAAEQLDRIFEPFVQVDAGLARTHDGVGLGLAISRNLARGMGGDLTVESTPGASSTFTLLLPRA